MSIWPDGAQQIARHFTIGAVTHITGIAGATLRAWERRYQFPQAERSAGGHRLYAEREVLRLLWVKQRQDEGMRTARAVYALETTGRATAMATALTDPVSPDGLPDSGLTAWQAPLLDALIACDSARAADILQEAGAAYPLEQLVVHLVGPTLAALGVSWSGGHLDVATEHFASNFLRHQMLRWLQPTDPPYRVSPIVLACAPQELHEGSLLMLGVLLRRLGWPLMYLGQSLPMADLALLVERKRPALVIFVAMSEPTALALAGWPAWLARDATAQPPLVAYGGRAFDENPALARLVPGTWLGATVGEGSRRVHRLMLDLSVLQP